jgi:hypothetical protein
VLTLRLSPKAGELATFITDAARATSPLMICPTTDKDMLGESISFCRRVSTSGRGGMPMPLTRRSISVGAGVGMAVFMNEVPGF